MARTDTITHAVQKHPAEHYIERTFCALATQYRCAIICRMASEGSSEYPIEWNDLEIEVNLIGCIGRDKLIPLAKFIRDYELQKSPQLEMFE